MHESKPGSQPILENTRWERYAVARANGLTRKDAYQVAGYEGLSPAAADRIERHEKVKQRIQWLTQAAAERSIQANAVTRNEIIESIRNTRSLAKEGSPVYNRNGEQVGVKRDLTAANRADEILAKMHGFMVDVHREESFDEELEGKTPKELEAFVLSLLEQVDPNIRKKLVSQISDENVADEDVAENRVLQ